MKLQDLTPEYVKECYEKADIRPVFGMWTNVDKTGPCGCALTAVGCANGIRFEELDRPRNAGFNSRSGFLQARLFTENSTPEIMAFIAGFDGETCAAEVIMPELYKLGAACRRAIFYPGKQQAEPDDVPGETSVNEIPSWHDSTE